MKHPSHDGEATWSADATLLLTHRGQNVVPQCLLARRTHRVHAEWLWLLQAVGHATDQAERRPEARSLGWAAVLKKQNT